MSEKDVKDLEQTDGAPENPELDEGDGQLYEEPPRMSAMDTIGVVVAVVALLVIGWCGYLWLTPGKSLADFLSFAPHKSAAEATSASAPKEMASADHVTDTHDPPSHSTDDGMTGMDKDGGEMDGDGMSQASEEGASMNAAHSAGASGDGAADSEQPEAASAGNAAIQPPPFDDKTKCAECGMFVARSLSHAVAYWSDGSVTQHDGWECLFSYGKENGLTLDHALVRHYGEDSPQPEWLPADKATYLYDTSPVKGSMPPFVAAYASEAEAKQALDSKGGTLMSFSELGKQW